jgi:hypothetical protein
LHKIAHPAGGRAPTETPDIENQEKRLMSIEKKGLQAP